METFLAVLLLALVFQTQPGIIEGTVVKLGTNETLPGTRVGLIKVDGGATPYSTTTGADGRFRFPDILPGVYRVLATRDDGYIPAEHGQAKPNTRGLPVPVGTGETKTVRLEMAAPGAISGRIFDRDGEPVGHAQVQALRPFYQGGRRKLNIAQSVQTNDLGEYRLFWLAPGTYYITGKQEDAAARSVQAYIRPSDDSTIHDETSAPLVSRRVLENGEVVEEVHVPTYFPGTLDFDNASAVTLHSGDDVRGMDINIKSLPPARHIRGSVIDGTTGQPLAGAAIRAVPQNPGPNVLVPNATADGKGVFEVGGLVAGAYYLFASTAPPNTPAAGRAGRIAIEVGSKDLENVTVIVPPAVDIPGRLVMEGNTDLDITRLRVSVRRDPDILGMPFPQPLIRNGTTDPSALTADGSFMLSGIGAGDYRISINYLNGPRADSNNNFAVPQNVYVKSVRLGNLDLLANVLHLDKQPEGQLEVILAANPGAVTGTVANDLQEPVPNTVVALLPQLALRSRLDLYRVTASDPSGRFQIRGLPPGDYVLFSWDEVENGAWMDPQFVQPQEARGMPVRVSEGATGNAQLTIIKAGR